jgi:hypothetical protein
VATLRAAYESGWPREIDLAADERFEHLRGNEHFGALIADLKNRPGELKTRGAGNASSTTN